MAPPQGGAGWEPELGTERVRVRGLAGKQQLGYVRRERVLFQPPSLVKEELVAWSLGSDWAPSTSQSSSFLAKRVIISSVMGMGCLALF